jgi:hypothetical protein
MQAMIAVNADMKSRPLATNMEASALSVKYSRPHPGSRYISDCSFFHGNKSQLVDPGALCRRHDFSNTAVRHALVGMQSHTDFAIMLQ